VTIADEVANEEDALELFNRNPLEAPLLIQYFDALGAHIGTGVEVTFDEAPIELADYNLLAGRRTSGLHTE